MLCSKVIIKRKIVKKCTLMKSNNRQTKKEKGDNHKGGDQNRYQPFITSYEVLIFYYIG